MRQDFLSLFMLFLLFELHRFTGFFGRGRALRAVSIRRLPHPVLLHAAFCCPYHILSSAMNGILLCSPPTFMHYMYLVWRHCSPSQYGNNDGIGVLLCLGRWWHACWCVGVEDEAAVCLVCGHQARHIKHGCNVLQKDALG